ncbi:hypothetical protein M3P05_04115 [Sansalvadorimonas sp. 2012CJ34-2]|uniref:Uncharacterized protein n=1 Tax=Parendozoicomonas callyspongiae TaxID=2942213 RepID=A0ABT0PCM0_9GAMM|nr:hypothetical protein [Sansalvadorimonas sp. 2012CJ34-2]MCL6269127.1 hypothetical protein [Sansalvadorimonas sp. 2012CJ34-2]
MDTLKTLFFKNIVFEFAMEDRDIMHNPLGAQCNLATRGCILGTCAATGAGIFLGHSCTSIAGEACVAGVCGAQAGHAAFKERQKKITIVTQPLLERNEKLVQKLTSKDNIIISKDKQIEILEDHVGTLKDQILRLRGPSHSSHENPPPYPYSET